jgi:hypothetical protein
MQGIPSSDHLRLQTIPIHIVATGSSLLPVSQSKVVHVAFHGYGFRRTARLALG